MSDAERIGHACLAFLTSAELAPLRQWWELQLLNSQVPAGRDVDPLRLAMAQGDRERLLGIKQLADAYRKRREQE